MSVQAAPSSSVIAGLTQRQKAAIIVKLLVGGGTSLDSLDLDADAIWKITNAMAGLGVVGRDVVDAVTAEFIVEMEKMGLVFDPTVDDSLSALSDHLDPDTLSKIKDRQSGSEEATAWLLVNRTEPEVLAPLIAQENPRVAAVVLSKLSAAKAAETVSLIEKDAAQAILAAFIKTSTVSRETINEIGLSLAEQIRNPGGKQEAFDESAAERIGAILNVSQSGFRDEMLGGFENMDPSAAEQIRKLMFTFADIPARVVPRDVSKFLRAVDDDVLVQALSGAATTAPEVKEFILSNISSRLAEQINESIEERGPVKAKDADAAMTQVVIAIKDLEKSGEITLLVEDEEEEG